MDPHRVALVGGAGKMGGGIALTLLTRLQSELTVMDLSRDGLNRLHGELISGLRRVAEKSINALRVKYASHSHLVSNEEIVEAFVLENMRRVHLTSELSHVRGASWVFEAIIEDVSAKTELFKMIGEKNVLYFSNSSSIPIGMLADLSGLGGQIVGLHFYNPVPQKRLVEVVIPPAARGHRKELENLCKKLDKIAVESADVAGFIGNGFLLREVCFAEELVNELKDSMPVKTARTLIDFVTEKLLLRPMGIYRLIQFIGPSTLGAIGKIMATYLEDQAFDLSGLDPSIDPHFLPQGALQPLPSWRELRMDPHRDEVIDRHFARLFAAKDPASDIARRILLRSQLIVDELVKRGVVKKKEDVDTVLKLGFDHLYSPDIGARYA